MPTKNEDIIPVIDNETFEHVNIDELFAKKKDDFSDLLENNFFQNDDFNYYKYSEDDNFSDYISDEDDIGYDISEELIEWEIH